MVLIFVASYAQVGPPFADVFSTIVGGIVAGYMVARRIPYNHVIIGLLIGIGSFFMTTLFVILVVRTIEGLLWMWFGFLVGGAIGGTLSATVHLSASRKINDEKYEDST